MKLSRIERWILSNQLLILEKLDPENSEDHSKDREAIEQGFELDYRFQHIYDDVMSEDECGEVLDILSMFDALQRSYSRLSDTSDIKDEWIIFSGFNGNNEVKQLNYARFLVEREGKFSDLELRRKGEVNSPLPLLSQYRKMLKMWEQCGKRYDLSRDEVQRITAV